MNFTTLATIILLIAAVLAAPALFAMGATITTVGGALSAIIFGMVALGVKDNRRHATELFA